MELPVIKIGNSKGIRLKKSILDMYDITDKVDLIFEKGRKHLKPVSEPRSGWASAFNEMRKNQDDMLLIPDVLDEETGEIESTKSVIRKMLVDYVIDENMLGFIDGKRFT